MRGTTKEGFNRETGVRMMMMIIFRVLRVKLLPVIAESQTEDGIGESTSRSRDKGHFAPPARRFKAMGVALEMQNKTTKLGFFQVQKVWENKHLHLWIHK